MCAAGRSFRLAIGAFALGLTLAHAAPVAADEAVRHIGIYVEPYYAAAEKPADPPRVAVGKSWSGLLASTRKEDIAAARDRLLADPRVVTPMTMMVLAIRLYDVGLRDDAAFWFYAAKDRYRTLDAVIDIDAAGLGEVDRAMRSFVTLAGPFINGYAFCEPENQTAIRAKALAWVEANPYEVVFMERIPARPGSRVANLAVMIGRLETDAAKETGHLKDPVKREQFTATRKQNRMDEKYCWK